MLAQSVQHSPTPVKQPLLAVAVTHWSFPQRPERTYILEESLQGLRMLHAAGFVAKAFCQPHFSTLKTSPSLTGLELLTQQS